MSEVEPTTGWAFVAEREAAAEIFDALLSLEAEEPYTMTELAEAADVPMKTLYVDDWLDELCRLGALEDVSDDESEAVYRIRPESDLMEAARTFDETVADLSERH